MVLLWLFAIGWVNASMVETRKRKSKSERDEKPLATGSSQSDDAISGEQNPLPMPREMCWEISRISWTLMRRHTTKYLVKNYALFEDDVEVDTRPKPKRRKEHVESSNTFSTRSSSADSGPYKCRFCGQEFKLSQSLGGHMNRHRSGKLLAKIDFIAFF